MSISSLIAFAGIAMSALSLLLFVLRLIFKKGKGALQCFKPLLLGIILVIAGFMLDKPAPTTVDKQPEKAPETVVIQKPQPAAEKKPEQKANVKVSEEDEWFWPYVPQNSEEVAFAQKVLDMYARLMKMNKTDADFKKFGFGNGGKSGPKWQKEADALVKAIESKNLLSLASPFCVDLTTAGTHYAMFQGKEDKTTQTAQRHMKLLEQALKDYKAKK